MPDFHDCHLHIQNLTHPHIDAFLERIKKDNKLLALLDIPLAYPLTFPAAGLIGGLYFGYKTLPKFAERIANILKGKKVKPSLGHLKIINLLLLMNKPADEYLMAIHKDINQIIEKNHFKIDGQTFNRVIAHGLIMDYTDRDYNSDYLKQLQYSSNQKPVVRQTEDMLAGMKRYNESLKEGEEARVVVLPFLGLNPENYDFEPAEKPESGYTMLPSADVLNRQASVLTQYMVTSPSTTLSFTLNNAGRFDWYRKTFREEDLQNFIEALKSSHPLYEKAKEVLNSFKQEYERNPPKSVRLFVDINLNKMGEVRKSSFTWNEENEGFGGVFSWLDEEMSYAQRNAIIKAFIQDHEDTDDFSLNYSIGRIEFLYKWFEQKNDANPDRKSLQYLLNKYFHGRPDASSIIENQSAWEGNIENVKSGVFAGIKMYPPLGFDPWPDGSLHKDLRKARVNYLYDFAEKNQIPITVHASDGGFRILSKDMHKLYTSPKRWIPVLNQFKLLRINFAHCGVQGDNMAETHDWKIILFKDIICKHEDGVFVHPNVYADLSELLNTEEEYEAWELGMNALDLEGVQLEHLKNRLLFGTDFMINLLHSDSYASYIAQYTDNMGSVFPKPKSNRKLQFCDNDLRHRMAVSNPERFLGINE